MPVRQISFDVEINPKDAELAGATATPIHYDVDNGQRVIFTATEPWGFDFNGWYKLPDMVNPVSTDKVAEIEVYESAKSYIKYVAGYTANYSLRTGRYIDLERGTIWDLSFEPYSIYQGRVVLDPSGVQVWYGGMTALNTESMEIKTEADTTMPQATTMALSFTYKYSPIGLTLKITAATVDNIFGLQVNDQVQLKFLA
jgi:hypothetical protein